MRLSDIIRNLRGIFERKRKNPVQLSTDSNLESKLKPLKIANKNTPIQISEDTVDVKGSLKVNGVDVSTDPDDDTGVITALNNATANELVTVGSTTTELDAETNLTFDGNHLSIGATGGLYFDGGVDTYIYEQGADALRVIVGGDILMQLSEKGDDGNEVNFASSCVGFTQIAPTYDSTNTVVDFRHSNKQFVPFGSGSITNLQLIFPLV